MVCLTPTLDANLGGRLRISTLNSGRQVSQLEPTGAGRAVCGDRYGSVSVVTAVLGGLPPGSVTVIPGDSLRIRPPVGVPCI
jgi:hypothetical protein